MELNLVRRFSISKISFSALIFSFLSVLSSFSPFTSFEPHNKFYSTSSSMIEQLLRHFITVPFNTVWRMEVNQSFFKKIYRLSVNEFNIFPNFELIGNLTLTLILRRLRAIVNPSTDGSLSVYSLSAGWTTSYRSHEESKSILRRMGIEIVAVSQAFILKITKTCSPIQSNKQYISSEISVLQTCFKAF